MEKKVYLLWFGQTLSWTGSAMSFFAIGVWIFETTGRASALSSILFTVGIVGVLTGPFGGVLADRFPRKQLIISFDLIILFLMCLIGYFAINDKLTLIMLIPFALAFGIFEIAHWTTWSAFLGDVVKKEHVTKISALFESAEAFAVLLGPIGGALIYSYFGLTGVIIVDLITCLFGIVTITFFKSESDCLGPRPGRRISRSLLLPGSWLGCAAPWHTDHLGADDGRRHSGQSRRTALQQRTRRLFRAGPQGDSPARRQGLEPVRRGPPSARHGIRGLSPSVRRRRDKNRRQRG